MYNEIMERTLILIKPDAIQKRLTGIILDRIESLGLQMAAAKVAVVTDDLARKHYDNLAGTPYVDNVVKFMMGDFNNITNHRVYAFVYEGENAVAKVREMIGNTNPDKADPWTIRGQFGCFKNGVMQNAVHASGTPQEAEREIALWFKKEEIVS
ncbi:nucleoside-diphosphate kinase [Elusimicrobium simillimum]|uniref:nucleoside-diphosphate kinase n=1 Tax=Elusimicrobium simillimum TaxID=3143438 RepID=UPI003C702B83